MPNDAKFHDYVVWFQLVNIPCSIDNGLLSVYFRSFG